MNAELMFQPDAFNRIARAVLQKFRHDKKRNALHIIRRIRTTGNDKVDNVIGIIMLAISNENFLAKNFITIVFSIVENTILRLCAIRSCGC